MIGLRIGAAELAEMEAGAPAVVLAPGVLLPHAPPLLPLTLKGGVLVRPGGEAARSLPLPDWARPLALVAPEEHLAERLLPLLPPGLPVLPDIGAVLGLLAEALRTVRQVAEAAGGERDRLKRALAAGGPPRPRRILGLPPLLTAGPAALPATQPLGRSAEGLCTVELHVRAAGTAGLVVRLLAGARLLGLWRLPASAVTRGWLPLDLPEPAAAQEEAVLEVLAEPGGEPPALSASEDHPRARLALRAWTAGPGWSVLPRHFDWAASGLPRPTVPLPLPAALLAGAVAEGMRSELVALGEEAPRLLLALPTGEQARLVLPAAPVGPADLLRLRLGRVDGGEAPVAVAVELIGLQGEKVASGWRELDEAGALTLALPLPPGPMVTAMLALRQDGAGSALLELSGIAFQAGAAGEPRRPPPAEAVAPHRAAVAMPGGAAPAQGASWRTAPPAPRLATAGPGGASAAPRPAAPSPAMPPGDTSFQDIKVHQHLVNPQGSYRHLDIAVSGLVSGGGLWRQLRLKLFDRRGAAGLEFREAKGWPQMFDVWPGAGADNFGPFWRLETEGTAGALAELATPHDRALIAAMMEVLPDLALRAAGAAGLAREEMEGWAARAQRVAQAVAEARGAPAAR